MSILKRSVTDLRGVGEQVALRLQKLQIRTLQDILFHLPIKYVDRTRIHPLNTVRIDDLVVIEALIEKVSIIPKPKRNLVVKVRDSFGSAELRFFHFNSNQQQQFKPGMMVRCFGQARLGRLGIQFIHPEYRVFAPQQILPVEEYLTPIYPTTEGISQKILQSLIKQTIDLLLPISQSLEILPAEIIQQLGFMPLIDSLQQLHFPTPECYTKILNEGIHPAQRRLAFEELLAQHLSLRQNYLLQKKDSAHSIPPSQVLSPKLLSILPFDLTKAQKSAINTITADIMQSHPMLRLIQGDVGSGKTLVAVLAALAVIEAGYQVALMVPTEILAEQHYRNILHWFGALNINCVCLNGQLTAKEKSSIKEDIFTNKAQMIIGTHALFQDGVEFKNLALIIIDEQHRFGVAQRLALHNKGVKQQYHPHQLVLTATPIPRTLAMTFYAELDYFAIDELPPGRKPITTLMVASDRREEILSKIATICSSGQQVYWVCTLIEESELIESTAAEVVFAELQQQLPQLKIALVHGKMKSEEKEHIMQQFYQGVINLLVATTVIEVGVDVPNASLMIIENPERLGLAQLHQLRGRVGRGNSQSYCILLYKKPLGQKAMQRLQFIRDSQDGFAIAEFDLKLRGPGEVFGTKQSGLANLRIANLLRDKDLLPKVAAAAELILAQHQTVIPLLLQRWIREQFQYASV